MDLLGFSHGGMAAQQAALDRPSLVQKMLLVGTAPEGGEDVMYLEKPALKKILDDPNIQGLQDSSSRRGSRARPRERK